MEDIETQLIDDRSEAYLVSGAIGHAPRKQPHEEHATHPGSHEALQPGQSAVLIG